MGKAVFPIRVSTPMTTMSQYASENGTMEASIRLGGEGRSQWHAPSPISWL